MQLRVFLTVVAVSVAVVNATLPPSAYSVTFDDTASAYLLNDQARSDLALCQGLTYSFSFPDASTQNHTFYFSTTIEGGDPATAVSDAVLDSEASNGVPGNPGPVNVSPGQVANFFYASLNASDVGEGRPVAVVAGGDMSVPPVHNLTFSANAAVPSVTLTWDWLPQVCREDPNAFRITRTGGAAGLEEDLPRVGALSAAAINVTYIDNSVVANATYTYTVAGLLNNTAGEEVSITLTTPPEPPSVLPVTDLALFEPEFGMVVATWSGSADYFWLDIVTVFEGEQESSNATVTGTDYELEGVAPGTIVNLAVTAVRGNDTAGPVSKSLKLSVCGDGDLTGPEQCDDTAGSPCCDGCLFATADTVCGVLSPAEDDGCRGNSTCSGVSLTCLPTIYANGTVCRASVSGCDAEEVCMNGVCPLQDLPKANGTECRPALSLCDIAETCDGQSFDCPDDVIVGNATVVVCREAGADHPAGRIDCDEEDVCDGVSGDCPSGPVNTDGDCSPDASPFFGDFDFETDLIASISAFCGALIVFCGGAMFAMRKSEPTAASAAAASGSARAMEAGAPANSPPTASGAGTGGVASF